MQGIVRSKQGKTVTRTMPLVLYHGRNDQDHTVILSIARQRYEYFLTPQQCETVEQLCRKGLARRALVYAKSRARATIKM